jgi:hypothetical protein
MRNHARPFRLGFLVSVMALASVSLASLASLGCGSATPETEQEAGTGSTHDAGVDGTSAQETSTNADSGISPDTGAVVIPEAGSDSATAGDGAAADGAEASSSADAAPDAPPEAASDAPSGPTCPYDGPPLINPETFPACSPACSGAHCVPAALVPMSEQMDLASCGSGSTAGFCTPDTFIESLGNSVPPMCVSVAGAEGRCLSDCLPLIASESEVLPQASCGAGQLCAPCYNPTASDPTAPTGACSIACDMPKDPPVILTCPYTGPPIIDPSVFPACSPACAGAHCVPSSLVPAGDQSKLATCPGGFCAPDSISENAGESVPQTCTSVAGAEGRCLSPCLPLIASKANLLPQDVCPAGLLCAPCYDPTSDDPTVQTGACSTACDMPKDPPVVLTCPWTGPPVINPSTFPACSPACAGAHCVPSSLVPASQQSELATCPGGFCTPDPIVSSDDNYVPPTCQPFADPASEGRCTSDCLPAVESESSELSQGTCASDDLCAPCNDPFTGAVTGACTVGCDSPKKPPFSFPLCCDYDGTTQGTCVPASLVPSGQSSDLQQDECPSNAADYLCVPNEYLPNPPIAVSTCSTLLGAGTCISQCVDITFSGVFSQDSCPDNHLCVPCLLAGSSTPGCN